MMTSDNLAQLRADRLNLWKTILSTANQNCSYPLLGRSDIQYVPFQTGSGQVPVAFSDPLIVQVRSTNGGAATIHALNTSTDTISRMLQLPALGIAGVQYLWDPLRMGSTASPVSQLTLNLAAHEGALLYLSPVPFTTAPSNLAGEQ